MYNELNLVGKAKTVLVVGWPTRFYPQVNYMSRYISGAVLHYSEFIS